MVITPTQLRLTNSKLWFCVGSNFARGLVEMYDGEDL